MKALGLILLGAILFFVCGAQFLEARASDSQGLASLWLVGGIAGLIIGFAGLVGNHRDHTRR